jgi:hypothetical protein
MLAACVRLFLIAAALSVVPAGCVNTDSGAWDPTTFLVDFARQILAAALL